MARAAEAWAAEDAERRKAMCGEIAALSASLTSNNQNPPTSQFSFNINHHNPSQNSSSTTSNHTETPKLSSRERQQASMSTLGGPRGPRSVSRGKVLPMWFNSVQ
jgi:hypothetical protein